MSDLFITPEEEELQEATAPSLPVEDFKALWSTLQDHSTEEVLQLIADQFADEPGRRQEVLTTWMAQELGYSRVFRRRSTLTREPLWDVLSAKKYRDLSPRAEQALALIGASLRPARTYLHPSAALATLAIWRHSENEELRSEATERLRHHALPDEPEWLFEVIGAFADDTDPMPHDRSVEGLVEMSLENSYWEIAALVSAMVLVHQYGRWFHSAVVTNLVHACDVASLQYPHEAASWLNYLADAAIGGQLTFSWLERPLRAAIRLSLDDPEREATLRDFAARRSFEADHSRLSELYRDDLKSAAKGAPEALDKLLAEVQATVDHNATRAARLLELLIARTGPRRVGSRAQRLRAALRDLATREELTTAEEWLLGIYVANMSLEAHAVEAVRRAGLRIHWEDNPFASREDLDLYLIVSDYERAFEELTCKFDGVTLDHADKYAAARVKYFVERRVEPGRVRRLFQRVFTPVEWLGTEISELSFVSNAVDSGLERFETRMLQEDLREEISEEYRQAGIPIETFEEIADLPVDRVVQLLKSRRQRRLLLGAFAGGLSGGLAPFSWGTLALADIPVLFSITADICSRFCWYFGFDPREHPDLPLEILAVALAGTAPQAVEPMLLRQSLNAFITRRTLVVGAIAPTGLRKFAHRNLVDNLYEEAGPQVVSRIGALTRRKINQNLQQRAAHSRRSHTIPVFGALLGAALNAALLYDLSEAAQAILTDRFLERKYPEWPRHIGYRPQQEPQPPSPEEE